MAVLHPYLVVLVAGTGTPCFEAHTSHGVDAPVGQCTLVMAAPVPAHVVENATVEVFAGFVGGESGRIFNGRILGPFDRTLTDTGATATIRCDGNLWPMFLEEYEAVAYDGPIAARDAILGLFATKGLSGAIVDELLTPGGDTIELGGVAEFDGGQVIIDVGESYGRWTDGLAHLFGYRLFDTPQGPPRVSRVNAAPGGTAVVTYTEGEVPGTAFYAHTRTTDTHEIIGYWEVTGASGSDADGQPLEIGSIPAVVPASPYIDYTPYVRHQSISDKRLVTVELADAARESHELDWSDLGERADVLWFGQPLRRPGEVFGVTSPTTGAETTYWLMSISHDVTDRAFETNIKGWHPAGEALESAADVCINLELFAESRHIGDENLDYYDTPTPDGTSWCETFTPPENYSSLSVEGEAHGANSYWIGGTNTSASVTRWTISQGGTEVGAGTMPVMDENYGSPPTWTPFSVPVAGEVEGGSLVTVCVVAGEDEAATEGPTDDSEYRDVSITSCAQGETILPGEPAPVDPVPPQPPPPDGATCDGDYSAGGGTFATTTTILAISVPAGTAWVMVTGSVAGALIAGQGPAPDDETNARNGNTAHGIQVSYGAGGVQPFYAPGTRTSAGGGTGTLVTDGAFENFWDAGPLAEDYAASVSIICRTPGPGWGDAKVPFAATDICVSFLDTHPNG